MEREVEVQEIDGIEYFVVATRSDDKGNKYDALAQLDNPENIMFVREIVKDGEEYFRTIEKYSNEYMEAASLFKDIDEY